MKLIMENWKKFISEDALEEVRRASISTTLVRKLEKIEDKEQKIEFAKKFLQDIASKDPRKLKPLFPRAFSDKNKDSWQKIADLIFNNSRDWNPRILQGIESEIEQNDDADAATILSTAVSQAVEDTPAEAEVTADKDSSYKQVKDEPKSPTDPKIGTDVIQKFAKFFIDNNLVVLQEGLDDILNILKIDSEKFKSLLSQAVKNGTFTEEEIKAFDKFISDTKEGAEVFANELKKMAQSSATGEPKIDPDVELEDEETVKVGDRVYTYTDEDVQELIKSYKNFIGEGEDEDENEIKGSQGLMKVKTLRQQEKLWIGLRDALNNIGKFRPIIDQERALAAESINIHEADNTQKAKILVRDLERLRKDLNDTDSTLNGYIKKASGGKYEAAAYMARFLAELKDVQNSIGKTIEDTKNFVGVEPMQENLNEADEESREDKIQNVRNVYENIKNLLRSLPEIGKTTSAEYEEISGNIKRSYEELMKIRKYFRNVGAFAKTSEMDVNEIKEEYINIRKDLTKTMSSFIEDLRKGDIDKRIAASFMRRLAAVGDFILQTFDVGPDEGYGYKTIEVPSDETSKEEIAKTTSAEPTDSITGEEAPLDAGMPDPDEVEPEKTPIEQLKDFYNNNKEFYNVLNKLLKLIQQNDSESLDKLKELFPRLKQLKENEEFVRVSSPENMLESLTNIKNQLINLFEELRLIELQTDPNKRDDISESIYLFATLMLMGKEMIEAEKSNNTSLINKIKSNIEGKVKQLVKSILSFTKEGEERAKAEELGASENTLDKLKKAAANFFNNFSKTEVSDDTDAESEENKVEENLLERLIRQELKVLNGKKMVRN